MEILDQLQTKVRNAVQKIEELQARVNELEAEKKQNEEKMAGLVKVLEEEENSTPSESSGSNDSEQSQDDQPQDSLYRHQY